MEADPDAGREPRRPPVLYERTLDRDRGLDRVRLLLERGEEAVPG